MQYVGCFRGENWECLIRALPNLAGSYVPFADIRQ
jgi:hypothetical protein